MAPLLNITLSVNNPHISVLGPNTTLSFVRVLHLNMHNLAVPNIRSFPEEFLSSFHTYIEEACSLSHIFSETFSLTPQPYYPIIFNNKAFNKMYSLMTTFNYLSMFIISIIQKFDIFPDKFTPYTSFPTIKEVQITSKLLCQHVVLSTPDRNAGIPDMYCPL